MSRPTDLTVATPVSHHFRDPNHGHAITRLSDALELRDNGIDPPESRLLYHCELNAARDWETDDRDQIESMARQYDPELVSFHLSSRYPDNELVDGAFVGLGEPYERTELLANIEQNCEFVRSVFPDASLLVENNNHLGTDAYEIVTDPAFISSVVDNTEFGLLLDVAHAEITAHNTETPFERYLSTLPLADCQQIHLSHCLTEDDGAVDAHAFLDPADWDRFESLSDRLASLHYVTLEYYRDVTLLIDQLQVLRTGTSDELLTPQERDSNGFGVSIASFQVDTLTEERARYAATLARDRGIDCLYFCCDVGDEESREVAVNTGLREVGTVGVYEHRLSSLSPPTDGSFDVSECDSTIRSEVLASDCRPHSRFERDPQLSESQVHSRLVTHLEAARADSSAAVLVARRDDKPVGFVVLRRTDSIGEIVALSACSVAPDPRPRLLRGALSWFADRGIDRVRVQTIADDHRLVQSLTAVGFSLDSRKTAYHWWMD